VQNLITLEDLVKLFDLPQLYLIHYKLLSLQCDYKNLRGATTRPLEEPEIDFIKPVLEEVVAYADRYGFNVASDIASSTLARFPVHTPDTSSIWTDLEHLTNVIARDMFDHALVQVSGGMRHYANRTNPFGQLVADAFPSTTNDLIEAGNCLAVECNVASAFHLMRAAEVGLWELGRDRQIPLAKSGKIEFAEWGLIIRELDEAVKAIQQWPNSATKEEAHKFYNAAVVEIRAFNDGWRRHSAHARPHMPPMKSEEAIALWGHVYRFMTTLAGKIGEGKHTLLVWA
jgi:hypothetical protein